MFAMRLLTAILSNGTSMTSALQMYTLNTSSRGRKLPFCVDGHGAMVAFDAIGVLEDGVGNGWFVEMTQLCGNILRFYAEAQKIYGVDQTHSWRWDRGHMHIVLV